MTLLRVDGLTKIYGDDPDAAVPLVQKGQERDEVANETGQTAAIAEVGFEVEQGEILVLMGLSGSGKSTVVRCINRLVEPTAGTVHLNDEDVTAADADALRDIRRHRMSMVFQQFALFPHRSVLENAAYGLEVTGTDRKEREKRAREVLEMVGLDRWVEKFPRELSGGMKQRVGLARALAVNPDVVLMDEALSALDPLIRRETQDELLKLQDELDLTLLFITHDLDEAIHVGDRIALMRDGRIVQTGTPKEILTSPATEYVERFVEDMDLAVVLTAEDVMERVERDPGDGPKVAASDGLDRVIQRMGDCDEAVRVVDADGEVAGVVTQGGLLQALAKTKKDKDEAGSGGEAAS